MIKVKNQNQIHIFRIQGKGGLSWLKNMVRDNFKVCPQLFHFIYIDEEGDDIEVSTDDDLTTILQLQNITTSTKNSKILKLKVKQDEFSYVELSQSDLDVPQDKSFELITSQEHSQYDLLNSSQQLSSLQVLEDEISLEQQKNIAGIVSQNLERIQKKCIEDAVKDIQSKLIQKEVENYLNTLYEEVERNEEKELRMLEMRVKMNEERKIKEKKKQEEELAQMVQRSLKKLLPSFIDKLSYQTTKSVKELLQAQKLTKRL